MEEKKEQPVIKNTREAGMQTAAGAQGVGKTYQNMYIIKDYVRDKVNTKVRGRKCLIFDTNGEYTQGQFAENDIDNFPVQRIAIKDIEAWCRTDNTECRRVDAKNLSIKEKKQCIEYIIKVYRNGMLVLEDINTYILSMTHMEDIVGGLVNLRHRAVDVLISYQGLRAIEPIIFRNSRWIRLHYQVDEIDDVKGKISDPVLMRIAQLMINEQYFNGNKRFFVTILNLDRKIEGEFSKRHFDDACRKYLQENEKVVNKYMRSNKCSDEEAVIGLIKQYRLQYYGN